MQDIKDGKYSLIYAHPETLVDGKQIGKMLRSKLFKERVCATVIDEVHMVSEWGKDFRKAFTTLGELTCLYADVPHLAMTATATTTDLKKLSDVLQFRNTVQVIENPDRTNIYLEIKQRLPNIRKYEKYDQILEDICSEFAEKLSDFPVTIVYCDNLESIGYSYMYTDDKLGSNGYSPPERIPENRLFGQYHKDYSETMKVYTVNELTKPNPKLRLVYATVALGMGLNAPSVSRVIHFRPPTTLEKYFQEVGRAGRSGQSATALMYFNKNDIASNRKGLHASVIDDVTSQSCLRRHLMKYFGFEDVMFNGSPELCCSYCKNTVETQAQK